MNDLELTETELKIIFLIRALRLFDSLEIKYAKQGELMWQCIKSDRGKFDFITKNVL